MPLSPSALEPLLRLALVPGVGPARLAALLERFGSAERVLATPVAEIERIPRLGAETARRIGTAAQPAAGERVRACLGRLARVGAVTISPDDLAYPDGFRTLADPPYLLFAIGKLDLLRAPGLAVVGTREPTEYGLASTTALATGLARAGWTVVSGMAKGIDAAAHAAALGAGGGTIGVLGHGIDGVYPAENRALFESVRRDGLLLSEYPPGEEPRAGNFPRRNRLIAGLSAGVLVVEMAVRSGAQHTVTYALEQGKEVFAVPGPIGSTVSEGTNQLLKDGARLVTRAEDILEELGGVGSAAPRAARSAVEPVPAPAPEPVGLSPEEARVFAVLRSEPRHVDEVCALAELAPSVVLATLLGLELKEAVEALPGKRFRRS